MYNIKKKFQGLYPCSSMPAMAEWRENAFNHQVQNTQRRAAATRAVADFHYGFLVSMQFSFSLFILFFSCSILSEPAPSSADSSPVFLFCLNFASGALLMFGLPSMPLERDLFVRRSSSFVGSGDLFQVNQLGKRECRSLPAGSLRIPHRLRCRLSLPVRESPACSCQSSEEYSTVFEGFLHSSVFPLQRIRFAFFDGGTFHAGADTTDASYRLFHHLRPLPHPCVYAKSSRSFRPYGDHDGILVLDSVCSRFPL